MQFSQAMSKTVFGLLFLSCITFARCSDGIPGGITPTDSHAKARKLLVDSLTQLRGEPNGAHLRLLEIKSVSEQVVAGYIYRIDADFAVGETDTKKNCKVELWHKEWTGFQETKFECDDGAKHRVVKNGAERKRRSLVGGASPVDAETLAQLRQNVSESFVQLADESPHRLTLNEVNAATKQVVAGILYKFEAKIGTGAEEKDCTVEVWDKSWVNFYQVTVDCGSGKPLQINRRTRSKRSSGEDDGPIDAQLDEHQALFTAFKSDFGRRYTSLDEESMRYSIFHNNLYVIDQLNKFERGTAVYGVTEFADLTEQEYFQRTGLLRRSTELEENEISNPLADIPDTDVPSQFDWREKGAVTEVKNQGNCGSCWAFSVTGNIEGINAVKTGQLVSLSEQELLDCDTIDNGCGGGLPDQAYKALETIGGLESEDQYPYAGQKHKSCDFDATLSKVQVSGAVDFKQGDEVGMAKWLKENGPISIGINANAMQFYRGGVSHPWKALCNPNALDHGVLIVGLGVADYPKFKKSLPYWIVKNSWGPR